MAAATSHTSGPAINAARRPGVHREQGEPLNPRLCDEHPVERVAVYRRQVRGGNRVSTRDVELNIAGLDESATKYSRRNGELWPVERGLDRDLPDRGDTEREGVFRGLEELPRALTESIGSVRGPGIEVVGNRALIPSQTSYTTLD